MSEKPQYNKDFILDLSLVIPCAHIPRDFIAERVTKSLISYLEKKMEENKGIKEVLFEITNDNKYNG